MGTAAWGGWGEGKCFHCNGLSWCGCHLQCPSLLHQTAVPPKLLGVLIIRLCGRTAQPSATPASPHVSMRGMINPALHSASPKETSRWCVATQLRVALSFVQLYLTRCVAPVATPTAMSASSYCFVQHTYSDQRGKPGRVWIRCHGRSDHCLGARNESSRNLRHSRNQCDL